MVPRLSAGAMLVFAVSAAAQTPAATELAALDSRQKAMVAAGDIAALAALSAAELRINAPTGRVLTRERFLAMMKSGQIAAESFDRTVEDVSVNGDVGIVMGREVFTPTAGSELGRMYGAVPLARRYTNVYVRRSGRWLWLARHANVVGPAK